MLSSSSRRAHRSVLRFSLFALLSAACSSSTGSTSSPIPPGGDFANEGGTSGANPGAKAGPASGSYGATPGGAQDIGYARKIIEQGGVPPAESLTVEGLLSEHDIPSDGPPCTSLLCARPATAYAPSIETGQDERWIQIGMTTGITNFRRPPLDVVALVDRSSAMTVDMTETTEAVARMVEKLRDDDRVAVLTFAETVDVVQPFGAPGPRDSLRSKVKAITASGSAGMLPGLTEAFAVADAAGADPSRLRRVMVFSCGYPDDMIHRGGGTFLDVVEGGAQRGIGLSFYGILLGFDYTLANSLSQARGGSYSYIEDLTKIGTLFDTDFDTMVTPIAYDLKFALTLPPELDVKRLYGIPGDPTGSATAAFDVKTAFISRRGGAIVARVQTKAGATVPATAGAVRLAYVPETAVMNTTPSDETTDVGPMATSAPTFSGTGVRKAVFLVNQLEGMKKVCASYAAGKIDDAKASVEALLTLMRSEAAALADPALTPEIQLVEKLAANVGK